MSHRAALPLILTTLVSLAADWPEFRGPTGQGHARDVDLPVEWSETENLVWKVPVPGRGWSSPVIADGEIWLTTSIVDSDGAALVALAYDVTTGRELLRVEVFRIDDSELLNLKNSHASPTPVIDGPRVYVHFGAQGTAALSRSGEILWKTRFPYISQHGNGGSPALYRDLLIINCDGFDQSFVVAVETETGNVRWKVDRHRPFSQSYSTPLVVRIGDRDVVISVGAFQTVALDPASGEEIWRVVYTDEGFSTVPRPVYGNGRVFVATGFNQPSLMAIRTDGRGDVTDSHVVWSTGQSVPLTPSPLLVGGVLYTVSDIGVISAMDAETGEPYWRQRAAGNYSASPVHADGKVYFQSEEGVTRVIASGTEFRLLATNSIEGATLASMAIFEGAIFLRSDSHLYRIGHRP